MDNLQWIDRLDGDGTLPDEALTALFNLPTGSAAEAALFSRAREKCASVYGRSVYLRGLIEFTNICARNCYYCGIRRGNACAERYRLTAEEILDCCARGRALGLMSFVLQGGEDTWWTDERLCALVQSIKARWPDCAVTLSVGEKSAESYRALREAGCDRYLLRHETASPAHYRRLHPPEMSLERRFDCLNDLKRLGYAVGCGMMIGSPFQTDADLLCDLRYMERFRPEMIGVGPFLPQGDTPFYAFSAGSAQKTLRLIAILRLMHPAALIPATTALSSADAQGHKKGMLAGANVVMPNLSPLAVRPRYSIYDHKAFAGSEAAESIDRLRAEMEEIGLTATLSRGDPKTEERT